MNETYTIEELEHHLETSVMDKNSPEYHKYQRDIILLKNTTGDNKK